MEGELWQILYAWVAAEAKLRPRRKRVRYGDGVILLVGLWAALHDRPVSWACRAKNWTGRTRPQALPDQSTMSRRTRRADFWQFLQRVGQRMNGKPAGPAAPALVEVVDGKPLELPNHTTDRDATWVVVPVPRAFGRSCSGLRTTRYAASPRLKSNSTSVVAMPASA
jgi:hypothetical protein